MRKSHQILIIALVAAAALFAMTMSKPPTKAPVAHPKPVGIPQLIDLGSTMCIPCREMQPILESLESDYRDRVKVRFIDVEKEPEQATAFRVSMIPTQILLDKNGKEVWRHIGFIERKQIELQFVKAGVK